MTVANREGPLKFCIGCANFKTEKSYSRVIKNVVWTIKVCDFDTKKKNKKEIDKGKSEYPYPTPAWCPYLKKIEPDEFIKGLLEFTQKVLANLDEMGELTGQLLPTSRKNNSLILLVTVAQDNRVTLAKEMDKWYKKCDVVKYKRGEGVE